MGEGGKNNKKKPKSIPNTMEATVICIDNSEWMRNGDYTPNRFEAQNDAANLISSTKIESNPESSVAVISMAGRGPKVLVTLSSDIRGILNSIASVKLEGKSDVLATLQVAKLALKHRQNKSQRQRILLFIGSPIVAESKELVQIGKLLKKNNIAVDVISFGEIVENDEKLTAFYNAVNNSGNPSNLVPVPTGPHILSDYLISVPALFNGGEAPSNVGGGMDDGFGFDASLDPELAYALRMSVEDEQRRRARAEEEENQPSGEAPPKPQEIKQEDVVMADDDDEDEEALMKQAMALSEATASNVKAPEPEDNMQVDDDEDDPYANLTEEEQMELALKLSMSNSEGGQSEAKPTESKPEPENTWDSQVADAMNDPSFVDSVLRGIPGVDPNDPLIQATLNQMKGEKDDDKDKDKKN